MVVPHNPSTRMRKPVVRTRDQDITIVEHDEADAEKGPVGRARTGGRVAAMNPRVPPAKS